MGFFPPEHLSLAVGNTDIYKDRRDSQRLENTRKHEAIMKSDMHEQLIHIHLRYESFRVHCANVTIWLLNDRSFSCKYTSFRLLGQKICYNETNWY